MASPNDKSGNRRGELERNRTVSELGDRWASPSCPLLQPLPISVRWRTELPDVCRCERRMTNSFTLVLTAIKQQGPWDEYKSPAEFSWGHKVQEHIQIDKDQLEVHCFYSWHKRKTFPDYKAVKRMQSPFFSFVMLQPDVKIVQTAELSFWNFDPAAHRTFGVQPERPWGYCSPLLLRPFLFDCSVWPDVQLLKESWLCQPSEKLRDCVLENPSSRNLFSSLSSAVSSSDPVVLNALEAVRPSLERCVQIMYDQIKLPQVGTKV